MLNVAMHMLAWFAWFAWFACSNFSPLVPGFAIKGRGSDEAMHSRLCQQATNVAPSSTSHKKKNKTSKRGTRSRHLKGSRVAKSANANLLLLALPALAQTSGSNTNGEKQKYDANIQNLWGPGCMPSSSAHDSYMSPSIAHLKAVQENACECKKLLSTVRVAWSEARIYARYQSIASVPPSPE